MSYQITELDYVDEDDFREVLKKWEKKALVTGCKIERRISRGVHFWMVPSFEPVKEEVSTVADLEDSDVDPDWQIDFSAEDLDIESDLSCDSVCEDILCELDNEDNIIVESYCDQEDDFVFPSDDESCLITDIEDSYPSIDSFFCEQKDYGCDSSITMVPIDYINKSECFDYDCAVSIREGITFVCESQVNVPPFVLLGGSDSDSDDVPLEEEKEVPNNIKQRLNELLRDIGELSPSYTCYSTNRGGILHYGCVAQYTYLGVKYQVKVKSNEKSKKDAERKVAYIMYQNILSKNDKEKESDENNTSKSNYKGYLQEVLKSKNIGFPVYKIVIKDNKWYESILTLNENIFYGEAKRKKDAEQMAAKKCLEFYSLLDGIDVYNPKVILGSIVRTRFGCEPSYVCVGGGPLHDRKYAVTVKIKDFFSVNSDLCSNRSLAEESGALKMLDFLDVHNDRGTIIDNALSNDNVYVPDETEISMSNNNVFDDYDEDILLCVICLDSVKEVMLCHIDDSSGHYVSCYKCAVELKNKEAGCPICRQKIDMILWVYN